MNPRIIGLGVDITPVARIQKMLDEHGDAFLARVFTPVELATVTGERRRAQRLAARFAAKEAVVKALGTGFSRGIGLHDVWIESLPTGQPTVRLAGAAECVARDLGVSAWHVSLSDCDEYAVASVIALG